MTALSKIDREVANIEKQKAELEKKRKTVIKRKLIKCEGSVCGNGCGRKTQIGKLIYLLSHHYVEPYSCTGGDYWKSGEGYFICPKCGRMNRLYDREHWQELKYHFKEIVEVYDRHFWGYHSCPSLVKAINEILEKQDFTREFWKRWDAAKDGKKQIGMISKTLVQDSWLY